MLKYDYRCNGCGLVQDNFALSSFICDCGGSYYLLDQPVRGESSFEPHFQPTIKQWVYSWKDMEEKGRKFRSKDHPNGFVITDPKGKFVKELKKLHKYREDVAQETYAKDGLKYKPGRGLRFDDKTGNFVPGGAKYQRRFF